MVNELNALRRRHWELIDAEPGEHAETAAEMGCYDEDSWIENLADGIRGEVAALCDCTADEADELLSSRPE